MGIAPPRSVRFAYSLAACRAPEAEDMHFIMQLEIEAVLTSRRGEPELHGENCMGVER